MRIPSRQVLASLYALVIALAGPLTAKYEGLSLTAYLDPIGIPTICYGETEGVKMGDRKTKPECDSMFYAKLGVTAWLVDYYVDVPMTPQVHAALTSFTYNVGIGTLRRSTLLKKLNAGDTAGACWQLTNARNGRGEEVGFTYAGGIRFPGLIRRRAEERDLCLQGAV